MNTKEEKAEGSDQDIKKLLEKVQLEFGCYECKFADREALGESPCCQNINGAYSDETGKCIRRR